MKGLVKIKVTEDAAKVIRNCHNEIVREFLEGTSLEDIYTEQTRTVLWFFKVTEKIRVLNTYEEQKWHVRKFLTGDMTVNIALEHTERIEEVYNLLIASKDNEIYLTVELLNSFQTEINKALEN